MNKSNKLLSDIVAFRTYSKYLPHVSRRESLEETINRKLVMDLDRFGGLSKSLSKDIIKAYGLVHELKIMPSMRSLQFAGDAITKNNIRQYNCSYLPIDNIRAFGETLFILLSGTGVGYSVQERHISKLPMVQIPRREGRFIIHDSIEGWAQALDLLVEAYFLKRIRPVFDYTQISPKGTYLATTGAKAPGPEPLKIMLEKVESMLKDSAGRKLKDIEVHDIICVVSDCVLAGGIRRAALISLFDRWSNEMLLAKSGEWYIKHPYRARANNSAVLPRSEVTKEEFLEIFNKCKDSGAGEPGFSWTDNPDWGFNPCHEIALKPFQFCNLTTISQTGITTKKEFLRRVYSAALLGTLQAAYTNFPYIRPIWKETTEAEALLGISFTGIADANGIITADWLKEGAKLAIEVNEKYAKKLGIKPATRVTAIKPEGSSSCVLGSSSGIHARHSRYYLRRVRLNEDEAIASYLASVIPELVEKDKYSANTLVVTLPQESPENAIVKENETALTLFKRAMLYNRNWVKPGHVSGDNRHNVSCTVSVRDSEWEELAEEMWAHRDLYSGISLLPFDGGTYEQAPFEACDKETYDKYMELVKDVDLKQVMENKDNTNRLEIVACSGNSCEII